MVTPKPINLSEADEVRFWSKVDMRGPDECWEWTAARSDRGYGHFYDCDYHTFLAHRVAFVITNGDTELYVCHTCNNPSCCNPDHLFAGTQYDNMQQCIAEGRGTDNRGEKQGAHKLTEDDVRAIRALRNDGWLQREIAEDYGISRRHVSDICSGKRWKHI